MLDFFDEGVGRESGLRCFLVSEVAFESGLAFGRESGQRCFLVSEVAFESGLAFDRESEVAFGCESGCESRVLVSVVVFDSGLPLSFRFFRIISSISVLVHL